MLARRRVAPSVKGLEDCKLGCVQRPIPLLQQREPATRTSACLRIVNSLFVAVEARLGRSLEGRIHQIKGLGVSTGDKFIAHAVINVEQVVSVAARIYEHLGG